jgi:hypothetical protein
MQRTNEDEKAVPAERSSSWASATVSRGSMWCHSEPIPMTSFVGTLPAILTFLHRITQKIDLAQIPVNRQGYGA